MTRSLWQARLLALLVPALLLGGAWGSQLIGHLWPCEMCHWQRWPHYGALFFAIGAFAWPAGARLLTLIAALLIAVSGAIGIFHAGVEWGWWHGITACTSTASFAGTSAEDRLAAIMRAPMVRCDVAQWRLVGVSLAGWNALISLVSAAAILVLAGAAGVNGWRPGDAREASDAMIRVDQAGEYGATRIYAGQLAVLGDRHPAARAISHMAQQEERHRAFFDRMIATRGVRPTLLQPFWGAAGFALGAVTALMGPDAAMACTAAVETEIDRHYSAQRATLGDDDPELSDAIADFQAEEVEHRDHALAAGAERTPGYPVLSGLIRLGCRAAIAAAKRI